MVLIALLPLLVSSADPQLVHSGTPSGISPETDCAMRKFAWEYGQKLQVRVVINLIYLSLYPLPSSGSTELF